MSKRNLHGAIAGALREARTAARLRQADLAERVLVTRETVSSWENGRSEPDHGQRLIIVRRLAEVPAPILARLTSALGVAATEPAAKAGTSEALRNAVEAAIRAAADEIDVPSSALRRTLSIALRHLGRTQIPLGDAVKVLAGYK